MDRASVSLRPVQPSDIDIFHAHQTDVHAIAMAGVGGRDRDAHAEHWRRLLSNPAVRARTILYGRTVVGHVLSFMRGDAREVGYWIGREYWGAGIAKRSLALFLQVESERPLHALTLAGNAASRRVLESNGFTVVGEDEGGVRYLLR